MVSHTNRAYAAKHSKLHANSGLEVLSCDTLTVGTLIGQGRFKSVHAGYHDDHGAVAVLRYGSESDLNEVRILGMLAKTSSLYVPETFCAFEDPSGALLLAQEVSMMGSIRSVLKDIDVGPLLTPAHRLTVASQIAGAVSFLASVRIVHADISCRNVLLFDLEDRPELTTVKITDFGFAISLPNGDEQVERRQPQATRWCAPETVAFAEWGFKTDVWSLGASLWELFAGGASPWTRYAKRVDVSDNLKQLARGTLGIEIDMRNHFPNADSSVYPDVVNTIVLSCLRVEPSLRPSANVVAVALERLVDVVDAFDGRPVDINQGLEDVIVDASKSHLERNKPPVQERSRTHRYCSGVRQTYETAQAFKRDSSESSSKRPSNHLDTQNLESPRKTVELATLPRIDPNPAWRQKPAHGGRSLANPPTHSSSRTSLSESTPPKSLDRAVSFSTSTASTAATPVTPALLDMREKAAVKCRTLVQQSQSNESSFFSPCPTSEVILQPSKHFLPRKEQEACILPVASRMLENSRHIIPLRPLGADSWVIDEATSLKGLGHDRWTLWTYLPPALQREDFSSECEARQALSFRQRGPHVLRDPCGREVQASAWNTRA